MNERKQSRVPVIRYISAMCYNLAYVHRHIVFWPIAIDSSKTIAATQAIYLQNA